MNNNQEWKNRIVGYKLVPANQLLANPDNARIHPAKQREALRGSLDTLGIVDAINVNTRTGYVIDGHARIEEALTRDENMLLPVLEVDISEDEETQFLLTFDRITALADWDKTKTGDLMGRMKSHDSRVQQMITEMAQEQGISSNDMGNEEEPIAQIDKAQELQEKWQVERGDLFTIGEHRLLCGDSTNADEVARVMGGEKADMVFTDPPYNVTGNEWDKFKYNDFVQFLNLFVDVLCGVVSDNASLYVCLNWRYVSELKLSMDRHFAIRNWIIWHHISRGAQFNFYTPSHQDILFYTNGDDYHFDVSNDLDPYADSSIDRDKYNSKQYVLERDGKSPSDVWYFPQVRGNAHENEAHPTQKPIELVSKALRVSSKSTDTVYDPFGGSGTTMVACEQLNRQCRMIEIEPKYCAVILERMSDMGLVPVKGT